MCMCRPLYTVRVAALCTLNVTLPTLCSYIPEELFLYLSFVCRFSLRNYFDLCEFSAQLPKTYLDFLLLKKYAEVSPWL